MAENKTIPQLLEDIASEICDHYCKYPEQYQGDKQDDLFNEHCDNCPLVCKL